MYVSCDVVVFLSCVVLFESVSVMAKSFRLLSFSRHGIGSACGCCMLL